MQTQITWAVVADEQHARILQRDHAGADWIVLEEETRHLPAASATEHRGDRSDRRSDIVSTPWYAVERRRDPIDLARQHFARALCQRLETAARQGRFGRLLLVAPPPVLGHLRESLGDAAGFRLRGTLDRDLAHVEVPEVVRHLPDLLPA
jgi:protein required for attachment to host cells